MEPPRWSLQEGAFLTSKREPFDIQIDALEPPGGWIQASWSTSWGASNSDPFDLQIDALEPPGGWIQASWSASWGASRRVHPSLRECLPV